MLVVSVELAELLSEAPGDINPLLGRIVGWEELKGVWNDRRYPVVWVDLPSGYPEANGKLKAQKFDPWQRVDSRWCESWESAEHAKLPLRDLVVELRDIRSRLPKLLGIVDPYILKDKDNEDREDEVPEDHQRILELLQIVEGHQAGVSKQDADEASGTTGEHADPKIEDLEGLFEPGETTQLPGE